MVIKKYSATKCLMCRTFGEFHALELPELGSEVAALLDQNSCACILSDLREVDLRLSMVDLYEIPGLLAVSGLKYKLNWAIVYSKAAETYRFLENVSVNRGQIVKVFTDYDEAQEWIKLDDVS